MMRPSRPLFILAVLAIMLPAAQIQAAVRVVFVGGHSILVQRVQAQGDQVTLHLLEGGTITLPGSAVEKKEYLDREEALAEWKARRKGATVAAGDGSGETSRPLSWSERMDLLASGDPPIDTGTEPEVSMLQRRGFSTPAPGPGTTLARYGSRAPTEIDIVTPGMQRDLLRVPIVSATSRSTSGSGQTAVWDPKMRELRDNAGEIRHRGGKVHDRSEIKGD